MSWCDTRYYCDLAKSDGSISGEILECLTPKKKKGGTIKRIRRRTRSNKRRRKSKKRKSHKKKKSRTKRK
jgi:hypothetical protein